MCFLLHNCRRIYFFVLTDVLRRRHFVQQQLLVTFFGHLVWDICFSDILLQEMPDPYNQEFSTKQKSEHTEKETFAGICHRHFLH